MSKTITIDPSIAARVNISPIGKAEIVKVYFTAPENWTGTYVFKLWNSEKKNNEITVTGNPLAVVDDLMTLTIDATTQELEADGYYYEIHKVESKRVIFKGDLQIVN